MKVSTSEIIVNNRGTISHQHGVGKDHAPYLQTEKGELAMTMLKTLCRSVDEKGILNPGTLFVDDKISK
jgi:alkyldihydroxyacetonephosphate synthase